MWAFLAALAQIILVGLSEGFAAAARAREEEKTFVIDREKLRLDFRSALTSQVAGMAKESQGSANAFDAADGAAEKKPPGSGL